MPHDVSSLLSEKSDQLFKTNPRYGRVFFEARLRHDLTTDEALLADIIQTLSRKTGWSFASKDYLARLLGVSSRTVQRALATLQEKELVRRHPDHPRQLQTTVLWITGE